MKEFVIRKNKRGRWIIVNPHSGSFAWSGSRWVGINSDGEGFNIAVSNFATASEAAHYAENVDPNDEQANRLGEQAWRLK